MNRHAKSLLAVAWLTVIPLAAVAEDAPAKGAQLAYTCLGCHGIAQVQKGTDFSFILANGRVPVPETPDVDPPGTTNPTPLASP